MTTTTRPLRRILGLAFGLALVFGTMVGVGILRLPGTVAAALGSPAWIMGAWVLGGLYSLAGAVSVAELAAMIPDSGGFRVYARRAFGERIGFVVGCVDWLGSVTTLAYGAVAAAGFLGLLWPPAAGHTVAIAVGMLVALTAMHAVGVRVGSAVTQVVSVAMAVLFLILMVGCFVAPMLGTATPGSPAAVPPAAPVSTGLIVALVIALRAVLTAYDGWYAPIYMAEESTDASRTVPRAILMGTLLVIAMYLVINLAFLNVLTVAQLAASSLPAADAARLVLPRGSAEFVTFLSLLTVLSVTNNNSLYGPRILFAIARDGLLNDRTALVSEGGTPLMALLATSAVGVALILTGSFEQILALFAVLFLITYIAAFLAVFVLRRTEPRLERPYRAFGYPFTTGVALLGALLLLAGAIGDDPRSGAIAAGFLAACTLLYSWLARRKRGRMLVPAG